MFKYLAFFCVLCLYIIATDPAVRSNSLTGKQSDFLLGLVERSPLRQFCRFFFSDRLSPFHSPCMMSNLPVLVFHAFKHAFKACFLSWHFLTNKYFSTLYTRWLITRPTFCPTYSYTQKSYIVLFIGQTTCNLSLALAPYEDWAVKWLHQ